MLKGTSTQKFRHPSEGAGPIESLWLAAARLRWHIPVLSGDGASLPYMSLEGEEPVALVFSTRRRATQAIDGWISDVVGVPVGSVTIDRESALRVLGRLCARGVQWIRIDHGPQSIRLPLEPLIGAMQRLWEQESALDEEASIWAWLERQDRILMLRDPAASNLPLVEIIDEQPSIRVFVTRNRARAWASTLSLEPEDPMAGCTMRLSGGEAVDTLQRLAHLGVDRLVIEQPGGPRALSLSALLSCRRAA